MRVLVAFFFATLLILPGLFARAADDCGCEKLKCSPCQDQVNVKFVAEKCEAGKRVKSCKIPVCKLMDPLPEICVAKFGKKAKRNVARKNFKAKEKVALRKVRLHVGIVMMARGKAWVTPESGKPKKVKVGLKIYEKDTIETGEGAKVRVLFKDKNVLNVTPKTKAKISSLKNLGKKTDKTMIDLFYGKIRSKVKKRYKGSQNNYYRVRTKAAVAGVRGTDFVVSYFEDAAIEMSVQTLEGRVVLAPRLNKADKGRLLRSDNSKNRIEVPKGTYAKFVIERDSIGSNVFSEDDIEIFVARGYMTPVYQLSEKELKILDSETDFLAEERQVASYAEAEVCRSPSGQFNYCAWTCKGNQGSTKCRTGLPGVRCVRKRCNANGKWAEETRLPASFGGYCHGRKAIVKPCDY